ncbi:MAG TPA: FHA domain-containing protein [Vicinamibacterales bacterium]|nr:FHA domain-containing protein [Vicinamibacterales bacterium]
MRVMFDRFVFDSDTRELLKDGQRLHVSPKAFDLLHLLLERRPRVVSKAELHDRIWAGAFVGDANLSVTVAEVRHALGDDSREGRLIRTVHRVGYAFCGQVSDVSAGGPSPRASYSRAWLSWNQATFQLGIGENVVGRDPRCDVWIDASGVSRRHARITVSGDEARLEDLDSSNGTFVGGRRVTSSRCLADGDVIELGAASVTFRLWSEENAPRTERIKKL